MKLIGLYTSKNGGSSIMVYGDKDGSIEVMPSYFFRDKFISRLKRALILVFSGVEGKCKITLDTESSDMLFNELKIYKQNTKGSK